MLEYDKKDKFSKQFMKSTKKLTKLDGKTKIELYDRDDDLHIDFVEALSNLRARNFNIKEEKRSYIFNFN